MLKIALTHTATRLDNYLAWLRQDPDLDVHVLCAQDNFFPDLESFDGLVFTGGVDMYPPLYGGSLAYSGAPDTFDYQRDIFEIGLFHQAQKLRLPTLAICRGIQLVGVALGAPLIQDLQTAGYQDHTQNPNGEDGEHMVRCSGSRFFSESLELCVNSAHHQALASAPAGFRMTGFSMPDGVPEVLESENPDFFLLALQWHPERLHLKPAACAPAADIPRRAWKEAVEKRNFEKINL
ncbi:MAG: gamma-glutamyl-gamma-aminobutyrate hydrolase family protein [Flavobacteriales bacterium]|nr:gamma-glutamyl-gamma-aminobutyrate hydrolase family protein [Flavobacteriales bacterium]MDW8431749.1 gamma-glutamyl-gamma-aminobutyrate hydrolase family protein [Flavobacteriales bacterium]